MIAMHLNHAARLLTSRLVGADAPFKGVSTDTRTLVAGQLFFALRGPNFDAHDKLAEAARAGAVGAVVEHLQDSTLPQIQVDDTRAALGVLARAWRERFAIPVLAVTGSAGKTTVKEMLAAIMRTRGPVLATRGNLNNDIGLPLTLFQLEPGHTAAVLEMGANRAGDIALLVGIGRPSIGVITLCAPAHLEGFGSLEGVARTKGEMFSHLPPDGVAILNNEDAQAPLWRELAGARRIVSFGAAGDFTAAEVHARADGTGFVLCAEGVRTPVHIPHRGLHNVRNALAAAAAARVAGLSFEDIARGLAATAQVGGRLDFRAGVEGCRLIDDSYNANPVSLAAAIDVLAAEPAPRWLVFGDMRELGTDAARYHREVGEYAQAAGIERLFTLGELARRAADGFGGAVVHGADRDALIAALRSAIAASPTPPTILIKGSRAMALDQVANALAAAGERACC